MAYVWSVNPATGNFSALGRSTLAATMSVGLHSNGEDEYGRSITDGGSQIVESPPGSGMYYVVEDSEGGVFALVPGSGFFANGMNLSIQSIVSIHHDVGPPEAGIVRFQHEGLRYMLQANGVAWWTDAQVYVQSVWKHICCAVDFSGSTPFGWMAVNGVVKFQGAPNSNSESWPDPGTPLSPNISGFGNITNNSAVPVPGPAVRYCCAQFFSRYIAPISSNIDKFISGGSMRGPSIARRAFGSQDFVFYGRTPDLFFMNRGRARGTFRQFTVNAPIAEFTPGPEVITT